MLRNRTIVEHDSATSGGEAADEYAIEVTLPQADLFVRHQPAVQEGPPKAWDAAVSAIDFACALAARSRVRPNHRLRDLVLAALLRRATITTEGIRHLLAAGLLEPAVSAGRTLLDIELAITLIHADSSDTTAHRLAAYHYSSYQRHGQDMLSNRPTREGVLAEGGRVPEIIEVSKAYARLLEEQIFDSVRELIRSGRLWHGHSSAEEAYKAAGLESDYHMTYDGGNWFVHAVNVDFDFDPSQEHPSLKPFVHRDPSVIQPFLGDALLRLHRIMGLIIEDNGGPEDPAFAEVSRVTLPGGDIEELTPHEALGTTLLLAFGSAGDH
jgi:hypothetical protein